MASPSSGIGGLMVLSVATGALVAMTMRSTVPLRMCSATQAWTFGLMKDGHSRFIAATDMRVPAMPSARRGFAGGIIETAGDRESEIGVADFALLDVDALLVGIDAQAHLDPVEDERVRIARRRREHGGAAGDPEQPSRRCFRAAA